MSKLKQLESFVAVVTRGSLTAAANAEGVAPAIMGRRLDALEERLGARVEPEHPAHQGVATGSVEGDEGEELELISLSRWHAKE